MAAADPLAEFFDRPSASPRPDVLSALERPMDARDALAIGDMDRLLDPAPLSVETGWCVMDDGVGYVAVRTPMPGTTAAMWDWWFDWQRRDDRRYQVWCPGAHFAISSKPSEREYAKPYWGATHFPDEDVGRGREVIRIDFKPPTEYGFSTDALEHPTVGTIVGGLTGSPKRGVQHSIMAHVFLRDADGLVLRSRFWLGAVMRPYLPDPVAGALARVLNRPAVRRRLPFRAVAEPLAHHCAVEYARLAEMLPDLYDRAVVGEGLGDGPER
jgi:hypothetical protein